MVLGEALHLGTLLTVTVVSSVILIILGIIYFAVSLLIIKVASDLVGFSALSPDTAILSAAILSAASLIASKSKSM
ncbi:MAG TPA: hypothetical protein HA254_04765 [Candidatus Diapherotrites archaeon]|uniref:Uncharacterized protein n=1 Tax=Candidatus Iainarchaeum sp. TaxID=3101447 RepID=A0A7J4IWV7_9ARCH|nr:hypothetical protein [Candidatus Diapherotrites archaeon]